MSSAPPQPRQAPHASAQQPECARGKDRKRLWIILSVVAVAVVGTFYFLPTRQWLHAIIDRIEGTGIWGVLAFVAVYIVLATLAVPVTPLNLAAGVVFGVWVGFVAALAGGVGAAVASFLLSRHLLQDWVKRRLACTPKGEALLEGIEEEQWKMVILTRLNPILPASLKNYSFGVTHVAWPVYLIGSVVGLAPTCFLYAYLGSAGQLGIKRDRPWTTLDIVLYSLGGVLAVALSIVVGWLGKRKLDALDAAHTARARSA